MAGQATWTKGGSAARCVRCKELVFEQWDPAGRLCATCLLEQDLFDREGRLERL